MKNFRLRVARVRALASLAVSIGLLCSTAAVAADPTVSITGVTFPEGNTGQQISGNVKVRLSAVTDHVVSFHLFTGGGTATSGVDYQPMTGDYVIPAGDIGASFGLSAIGDETPEPDETVNLSISNVVGATVTAGNAVATITNDDGTATPSLSIGDVSIAEGDSGTKTATFTVSLSSAAASTVSFNVATANGTATAGSDYVALASTALSITAGQTSKTVSVTINGDTANEPSETFNVNVTNVTGAAVTDGSAVGTITNDDAAAVATLSVNDVSVTEGDANTKTATFTITLSAAQSGPVLVDVATANGSATAGSDYVAKTTTGLRFPAGSTSKTFAVTINGDTTAEADETFTVNLSNASGATIADGQGLGTITNDDAAALPVLSIADVSQAEGNSGQSAMVFTISLSKPATGNECFELHTASGSATQESDFAGVYAATCIPFNDTSTTISVWVNGDTAAELDETFTAGLYNIRGAEGGDTTATGTILNDDGAGGLPDLSIADLSMLEGNSGNSMMSFQVSLTAPAATDVRFDAATSDGSAHQPGDYVAQTWTSVLIPAGSTSATLQVPVVGDGAVEANETFTLTLSNVSGANGVDLVATGTITNDDVPQLSVGDVSITEGNSGTKTVAIPFTLDQPALADVCFLAQLTPVTASAGSDYVDVAPNACISAGQTSYTFNVSVVGDAAAESDETFMAWPNIVTGNAAQGKFGIVTILNDDGGSGPTLSINDVSVTEGNSATKLATFTITLSTAQSGPVLVDVATANGTATAGSDYVAKTTAGLRIPAGTTSKTFAVTINGDTSAEADETFTVNLSNASGATIADAQAVGTITNDDAGGSTPVLSIGDVTITEGNSSAKFATFTVSLAGANPNGVGFYVQTQNNTAVADIDYVQTYANMSIPAGQTSATFGVQINGDTEVETDETFFVNVSNVSGATVGDSQAIGTITNDDAPAEAPTVSVFDVTLSEGNVAQQSASITVGLSHPTNQAVFFQFTTSDGTATGSDYVARDQQFFVPAGQQYATFGVLINGDTTVEADETFNVTLSSVTGATLDDGQAVVTIRNDDGNSTPTLTVADVSTTEGNSGGKTLNFTLSLSAPAPAPVEVYYYTEGGSATGGSDYQDLPKSMDVIPAGQSSINVSVTVIGDTNVEPNETFTLFLYNVNGAALGDSQAQGTITNDDGGGSPSLSIADASVAEGNSGTKTLTFTVSLSAAASGTVSYDIATSNGTATSGSDYVASTLTGQTISAGATSKTFAVTINGDTTTESNETFNVTLSNVSGATLGDGTAVGTITNDDGGSGPTLSIGDVSVAEGNSLSKQVTFTVTLSAAASGAVTYNIATADGTAIAPTDYTAKSLTGQSIAAGTTSKTFTVAVKGDKTVEQNETFLVNVTNVAGATLADGQATGTITNDDAAALTIARFDAKGIVDDVDDGNRQPQVAPSEYATLLADSANQMCRRAPNATVIAIEGIEHKQVLADLADAANAICASKPAYTAVMADNDSRGFLIATAAKGEVGTSVLGQPEVNANAKSTTVQILGAGHDAPVTIVLANGSNKALTTQLQQRAKAQPNEALVLLGANAANGMLDLTKRELGNGKLPAEHVLVSPALLDGYRSSDVELTPLPASNSPAQLLRLQ